MSATVPSRARTDSAVRPLQLEPDRLRLRLWTQPEIDAHRALSPNGLMACWQREFARDPGRRAFVSVGCVQRPERVAVIGVGILGASVGWNLSRHGAAVVFIDAGQPGEGVTNWSFSCCTWLLRGCLPQRHHARAGDRQAACFRDPQREEGQDACGLPPGAVPPVKICLTFMTEGWAWTHGS
ncbi:FAD-dependent oxidoreductase [Streptomyces decoyicus]|uniref:FAD-dependent oxidoreductase n=1 Tax=Streptomyces decoyicus TaxID=249567 RepID=UPI0038655B67